MSHRFAWPIAAVLALAVAGFWQQWWVRQSAEGLTLRGRTMGTTYTVRVAGSAGIAQDALRQVVEARLRDVNAAMSTWDAASELSRLNAAPDRQVLPLSPALRTVLGAALALAASTGGAFDPTVGPLVNLWGFGPEQGPEQGRGQSAGNPSEAAIAAARERTGWQHLRLDDAGLTKERAGLYVDLSANAKGYGVDAVAGALEARGLTDYLVEIGGDLRVRGRNPRGEPWAVGIDQPLEGAPQGERLQGVVRLEAGALATSGTYRRFRRGTGGRSHHIIDPRTGRPTPPGVVSVTVLAPDGMTADGIATALMVLGVEAGLAWVQQNPGVEALFLLALPGQPEALTRRASSGFPPLQAPR